MILTKPHHPLPTSKHNPTSPLTHSHHRPLNQPRLTSTHNSVHHRQLPNHKLPKQLYPLTHPPAPFSCHDPLSNTCIQLQKNSTTHRSCFRALLPLYTLLLIMSTCSPFPLFQSITSSLTICSILMSRPKWVTLYH